MCFLEFILDIHSICSEDDNTVTGGCNILTPKIIFRSQGEKRFSRSGPGAGQHVKDVRGFKNLGHLM
ncbi:Uncharacterized protein dnm_092290 [Desulfonema magnum]|uniref:Uncharacterized protein n=1 Tax=Desulfonema magnum TaxID=45655 RepID=A0A975GTM3_9BACT|nr:Uncharacterized protein dnm_092290 [Desulfonema magnum]